MNAQTPVVPTPEVMPGTEKNIADQNIAEKVISDVASTEVKVENAGQGQAHDELTWTEEIELAGNQLVEKFKELIDEGNVRRLILRTPDDSLLIEIPLVAGAVVGGVLTIFALPLAVLGAIASVLARVKVEIVRVEKKQPTE